MSLAFDLDHVLCNFQRKYWKMLQPTWNQTWLEISRNEIYGVFGTCSRGGSTGGQGEGAPQWKMRSPSGTPFWPSLPRLSLKYTSNILNSAAKYTSKSLIQLHIVVPRPLQLEWCTPLVPHLASARTALTRCTFANTTATRSRPGRWGLSNVI